MFSSFPTAKYQQKSPRDFLLAGHKERTPHEFSFATKKAPCQSEQLEGSFFPAVPVQQQSQPAR